MQIQKRGTCGNGGHGGTDQITYFRDFSISKIPLNQFLCIFENVELVKTVETVERMKIHTSEFSVLAKYL